MEKYTMLNIIETITTTLNETSLHKNGVVEIEYKPMTNSYVNYMIIQTPYNKRSVCRVRNNEGFFMALNDNELKGFLKKVLKNANICSLYHNKQRQLLVLE